MISNSINTSKKILLIMFLVFILTGCSIYPDKNSEEKLAPCIISECEESDVEVEILPESHPNKGSEEKFVPYTITECEDGSVEVEFFSEDSQIIYQEKFVYADHLCVENVNKDLYKIVYTTGVNSNYTVFVDVAKLKASTPYFNLLFNNENMVAFMEKKRIYLTDIFNSGKIYASINRDFTETAVPQSAIISFDINDDMIYLTYFSGKDYEEKNEQIEVKCNGKDSQ